jgi:hypothetical protein
LVAVVVAAAVAAHQAAVPVRVAQSLSMSQALRGRPATLALRVPAEPVAVRPIFLDAPAAQAVGSARPARPVARGRRP